MTVVESKVQVRQLVWEGVGARVEAPALGLRVFYRVDGSPGNWTLTSPGETAYVQTPGYQTQRAAQAAAQIDFERRICAELENHDKKYEAAVAILILSGRASTAFLQREMGVSYKVAASFMERAEAEGVVSRPNVVGKREVLAGRLLRTPPHIVPEAK